jgi:hypothetical protein
MNFEQLAMEQGNVECEGGKAMGKEELKMGMRNGKKESGMHNAPSKMHLERKNAASDNGFWI